MTQINPNQNVVGAGAKPRSFEGPEDATESEVRAHLAYNQDKSWWDNLPQGVLHGLIGAAVAGTVGVLGLTALAKYFESDLLGIVGKFLGPAGIIGGLAYAGYSWWNRVQLDPENKGAIDSSAQVTKKIDDSIKTLLGDSNSLEARIKAAQNLGNSNNLKAVIPLRTILGNEKKDVNLRAAAAQALGQLFSSNGNTEACNELLSLLDDKDPTVKEGAIDGLGNLCSKGQGPEELAEILVEFYNQEGQTKSSKQAVLKALGKAGFTTDPVKNLFLETLNDTNNLPKDEVKKYVIDGLEAFVKHNQDTNAIEALIELIGDPNHIVAQGALNACLHVTDKNKQPGIVSKVIEISDQKNNLDKSNIGFFKAEIQLLAKFSGLTAIEQLVSLYGLHDTLNTDIETALKQMPAKERNETIAEILADDLRLSLGPDADFSTTERANAARLCKLAGRDGIQPLLKHGVTATKKEIKVAALKTLKEILDEDSGILTDATKKDQVDEILKAAKAAANNSDGEIKTAAQALENKIKPPVTK